MKCRWWQKGWRTGHPSRLGSFVVWLNNHRPDLEIRILKWSYGFLKFFGRGMMVPEFDAACGELAVGDVSDVVETAFGYHLIVRTA